jgi:hypothetical protein
MFGCNRQSHNFMASGSTVASRATAVLQPGIYGLFEMKP